MFKESISVYNPADPFERALQSSFHRYNEDWLTSFECRLAAKGIASLKIEDDWMYEGNLFAIRANHLMAPEMAGDGEEVIFPTHLLFLRDILENRKISCYLNDPIVFVSKPIAFYLLKDYPIHLIVNLSMLDRAALVHVGGLYLFEDPVELPASAIIGIKIHDEMNKPQIERDIEEITLESNMQMNKAAVTQKGEGVFGLERGIDLAVKADDRVQHKRTKKEGKVYLVEPGDVGNITVLYDDGERDKFNKHEFVSNFTY